MYTLLQTQNPAGPRRRRVNVYAVMLNDSNRDVRVRLEQKYGPDNIYLIGNAST